jgi:hypothetical protein
MYVLTCSIINKNIILLLPLLIKPFMRVQSNGPLVQ